MNYNDVLKNMGGKCPFCDIKKDLKIYDYASAYMTIAMAPYGKDHLLIIPKRHVDSIFDLNIEEHDEIQGLIRAGIKMLKKVGYTDYSIMVREGVGVGKSVKHIHYHILPNIELKALGIDGDRKFLDEKKSNDILKKLKENKV